MPRAKPATSDRFERIGVVSDTHGHTTHAMAAVRMLESLDVQLVLHCGDIGTPEIVALFAPWPTHFVFGNTDHDRRNRKLRSKLPARPATTALVRSRSAGGKSPSCMATTPVALVDARNSGRYDLVCYGHTHQAEQHRQGPTLVLNPGALYRANPHSFALVTLSDLEATIINCRARPASGFCFCKSPSAWKERRMSLGESMERRAQEFVGAIPPCVRNWAG